MKNFIVREILERTVEAEDCAEVQELYDNEDIVLDYNDHVSTEIVPETKYMIVLTDAKDGTVIVYHLADKPKDPEAWLSENYSKFDSNCSWMETTQEIEHVYD